MNCSSEPGVIAAGAGALPGARRRYEAGTRTYGRAMRTCLALLAATALLALAAPAQAQTTTVTQSGAGPPGRWLERTRSRQARPIPIRSRGRQAACRTSI